MTEDIHTLAEKAGWLEAEKKHQAELAEEMERELNQELLEELKRSRRRGWGRCGSGRSSRGRPTRVSRMKDKTESVLDRSFGLGTYYGLAVALTTHMLVQDILGQELYKTLTDTYWVEPFSFIGLLGYACLVTLIALVFRSRKILRRDVNGDLD